MLGLQPLTRLPHLRRSPSLSDKRNCIGTWLSHVLQAMSGGFAIGCRGCRPHKIHYAKCGSKPGTAAAAAPYIMNFMQHSRQNRRQPLSLSEPPPALFRRIRCRFHRCASCHARRQVHRRPSAPRGSLFFLLTAVVLRLRFREKVGKNKALRLG